MRGETEVKTSSQDTMVSSGLTDLSTKSEVKFRSSDNIVSRDQKRVEAAMVKPTTTSVRRLQTTRNKSLTEPAYVSRTFIETVGHVDSNRGYCDLNKEQDNNASLTTTKVTSLQPKIGVSTVISFSMTQINETNSEYKFHLETAR